MGIGNGEEYHTPISECTAKGGPENCPYHGRLLRRERKIDESDLLRPDALETVDGSVAAIRSRIQGGEGYSASVLSDLDAISERVDNGELAPLRMPADAMVERRMAGLPRWFRSLYHLLAEQSNRETAAQKRLGDRSQIADQEKTVVDYARARGVWDADLVGSCERELGARFSEGGESYCFWDKADPNAPKTVVKVNATVFNKEPVRAMERIMLHNLYFPEAALTVEGIGVMHRTGKHAGDYLAFRVRQEGFDFSPVEVADEDRLAFMKAKGFSPRPGTGKTFTSDDAGKTITIGDLNVNNIRLTADGRLIVMDALESLNLPCYGRDGTYDLANPPAHIFTKSNSSEGSRAMDGADEKTVERGEERDNTPPRPWETPPTKNPYYDAELQRELRRAAQDLTWEKLHRNAIIRHDPDAEGAED